MTLGRIIDTESTFETLNMMDVNVIRSSIQTCEPDAYGKKNRIGMFVLYLQKRRAYKCVFVWCCLQGSCKVYDSCKVCDRFEPG